MFFPRPVALAAALAAAAWGLAAASLCIGAPQARTFPDGGLSELAMAKDFRAARESSYDRTGGNADFRSIDPGATLTLAEIEGPAVITHIWFTIAAGDRYYPRLLTLRMYWDGEDDPSVEAPIGDFFAVGWGLDAPVESLPVAVSSNGRARNCYWPMPFRKSARITVTNDGTARVGAFYYYIDYRKYESLPADTLYFHAQYRQEIPAVSGRDYLICEARGRGHYVGTVLSVHQNTPGWWGEGDDKFYIDGADQPQMVGTGSEDYFCDAWGIRRMANPFYGCPVTEGFQADSRHTCYRWHIPDPVPFTRSLRVTIEHRGAAFDENGKMVSGFAERADDFSSVAFWYQQEPHYRFYSIPPGPERLPESDEVLIEGEGAIDEATSSGDRMSFQRLGGTWSGGGHLFYQADAEGDFVEIPFTVEAEGAYDVYVYLTRSWDYAVVQCALDGRDVGRPFNAYSPDVKPPERVRLGRHRLSAGVHRLRLTAVGRDGQSKGYYMGLDAVGLKPAGGR